MSETRSVPIAIKHVELAAVFEDASLHGPFVLLEVRHSPWRIHWRKAFVAIHIMERILG